MASKKVGITAAWLAATASATMLAVPVASGSWRDAGAHASAGESVGRTSHDAGSPDRCDPGRPWTHVPVDSRVDAAAAGARSIDAVVSTVFVGVPRTAVVRLDDRGRTIAAWTNTGCPPRPGDDLWIERDGSLLRASDRSLFSRRWTGDFTAPGVWVPQTAGAPVIVGG